jgi:hypothetical protein
MSITGYPNFSALKDRDLVTQLKLVWDALQGLSNGLAAIQVPDVTDLTSGLNTLKLLEQQLDRRISDPSTGLDNRVLRSGDTMTGALLLPTLTCSGVVTGSPVFGQWSHTTGAVAGTGVYTWTTELDANATYFVRQNSDTEIRTLVAGVYQCLAQLFVSGCAAGQRHILGLKKNGTTVWRHDTDAPADGFIVVPVPGTFAMNGTTDYISAGLDYFAAGAPSRDGGGTYLTRLFITKLN